MRVEGLQIEFPTLNENPFSTSPLETGQKSLYVGRLDIRSRISRHINFRSNRRLLLVGEMGSGRTSLLRCSASEAPVYVHIDHISASNPAKSLLENLYSELIDYDIPQSRTELVRKIVEASRNYTSKIPLIVIDMPTVETSVMTVALRDALPSLERLQAVIVVVIEPKQRSNLTDSIVHSFASIETLEALSVDEVKALVERRVASATLNNFELSTKDAQYIHSLSGGKPSEIIRFMRDSIDSSIHPESHNNHDTVLESLTNGSEIEQYAVENEIIDDEILSRQDLSQDIENKADSEIIDASTPWQDRESIVGNQDPISEIFGFDLNLDDLSDSKSSDEPIEPFVFSAIPDNEEYLVAQSEPRPDIDAGTFGALLGRTRDINIKPDVVEEKMVKDKHSKGAELWVSKDLIPAEEPKEIVTEQDSAALIHDEIGLPDVDLDLFNEEEIDNDFESQEMIELDVPQSIDNIDIFEPIIRALQNLAIVSGQKEGTLTGQRKLAEALASMRVEKQGNKHDFPLKPSVLSALSNSESYVVSIAQSRRFSPSDKEILQELNIKRPRLSQISNRLLKSGILNVRTVGRSRYFQLTQDARAQLTAWGLIGGVE